MKVYELIVEALRRERVNVVFAVMGDGNMRWLSLLTENSAADVYYTRTEGAAVAMADGYARITGSVGVCAVTAGPGLTEVPTSLVTAARAATPLLLIAGDTPATEAGSVQFLDQRKFVEGMSITARSVRSVDTAVEDMREAFSSAKTYSQPVVLNVSMDVQEQEYEWDVDYEPLPDPTGRRTRPDRADVDSVADLLTSSSRPIIIAGRGAARSNAGPAISALARRTGALLGTTLQAKGLFTGDAWDIGIAGQFATTQAQELFAECDCVVAVGASLNQYTIEGGLLFPRAKTVQIDTEPTTPALTQGFVDCFVQGDAQAVVEELDDALRRRGWKHQGWRTKELAARLADGGPRREESAQVADGGLDPRDVVATLDELVADEEVIFVIGVGHFWWFALSYLGDLPSRSFVLPTDFGAIGQALPTGLGVAVGANGRRVVIVEGDASLMMQIQEFDTASRYGLAPTVIVMNDDGLGAEYHKLKAHGLAADDSLVPAPNFAAVAHSLGCAGGTASDLAELRSLIEAALASDSAYVVDAKVTRDVVSAPYRRIYYGEVEV